MQKKVYLYLEDLVGNLFITLKQAGYHVDSLTYDIIDGYAVILGNKYIELGIQPNFMLSRERTNYFLEHNQELYEEVNGNEIRLIKDVSIDELINKYHGYLPLLTLIVILDKDTIDKTINLYERNRPTININKTRILTNKNR